VAGLFILTGLTWYRLSQPAPPMWNQFTGETMGTTFVVKWHGEPDRTIRDWIVETLDEVNAGMSTYRDDSELSRFNASGTAPFQLSPEVFSVMRHAVELSRETDGAFDITVGPVVNLYGFGPDIVLQMPSGEELATARKQVGFEHLTLSEGDSTAQKSIAELYCDLSAIAKGYGVDQLATLLESRGVEAYFIEIGGEIRCRGLNPDGATWRVGIEKPISEMRELHRVVSLSDMAIATSGTYRNYVEANGTLVSHTIDPRSGRPVSHALVSVSVLHESCEWADGYATALMVMGEEVALKFANERGLAALLLIQEDDGEIREVASESFESYLSDYQSN
jgi:thiamine biosynthesis lipoprotein